MSIEQELARKHKIFRYQRLIKRLDRIISLFQDYLGAKDAEASINRIERRRKGKY